MYWNVEHPSTVHCPETDPIPPPFHLPWPDRHACAAKAFSCRPMPTEFTQCTQNKYKSTQQQQQKQLENEWKYAAHLEDTQQGTLCLFIHRFLIHYPTHTLSSTDWKCKCISIKAGNEIDFLPPPIPFPATPPHAVCIVTNCVSFFSPAPTPSDFWVAFSTSSELQLVLIV